MRTEPMSYVMHYPHKVGEMLKKAWQLRRKIRRRQKEAEGKAKRKRTSTSARTGRSSRRSPTPYRQIRRKEGTTGETSLPGVKREASSPEVTPPDWGRDDDSDVDPTAETPEEQEQEEASEAQWPWRPAGRPSDGRARAPGTKAQRTCGGAVAKTPQPVGGTKAQRA